MALIEIRARFRCDDCGREFSVQLDPVDKPPTGWSVFDVAEDAIRGGAGYIGPDVTGSVQKSDTISDKDNKHLCGTCTEKTDEESTK